MTPALPVTARLTAWAEQQALVRVVLLTSNRAKPDGYVDALSDYDVVLFVDDIQVFFQDRSWVKEFAKVLVSYWDEIYLLPEFGLEQFGNVIQYENLRIDFTVCSIQLAQKIVETQDLPADLDDAYRVLLDKDKLTNEFPAATQSVYILPRPNEASFHKVVEDFLSTAPHLAKCLWRQELLPAKWCLDYDMKHNFLRPMLEWFVEIDHDWSLAVGNLGKGLKTHLPPDVWQKLEATYAGADINENWEALLRTLALFREIALDVADHLGFSYPETMHQGVVEYVTKVRELPQ